MQPWLGLQRWYWRHRARDPQLRDLLTRPLPSRSLPFGQQRFLVADLETTALDPAQGEIASIAWVIIEHGRIQLQQARHYHLALQRGVGQSAVFHQLTDTDLARGLSFTQVLPDLLQAAAGSTLVLHHAALDLGYLNRYLLPLCGAPLLLPVQDTLQLEYRTLTRRKAMEPGDLRLSACRARHGLPAVPVHDALGDALATAELFLALASP